MTTDGDGDGASAGASADVVASAGALLEAHPIFGFFRFSGVSGPSLGKFVYCRVIRCTSVLVVHVDHTLLDTQTAN